MGRKAFPFDLTTLASLAGLRLSQPDIAAAMGCSLSCFEKALATRDDVREAYEKGKADMKHKIGAEVLARAMNAQNDGSWQLLMHLHKTTCGASETVKIESVSEKKDEPGMSMENKRRSMAELMGEDPNDEESGTEDDGT